MMRSAIILSFLCTANLGLASKTPAEAEYQTVVTGSRGEETLLESTRSIEAKESEELLEEQPTSVPDALRQSPGVHLQETNRGSGAPIIRGFIGPQNGIRIDGIRFNSAIFRTGPNQYLALSDPYAVGRIEILRGPSSVFYGSGAMGGIVQLLTTYFPTDTVRRISTWHQSADDGVGIHGLFGEQLGDLSYIGSISGQHHGILRTGDNTYLPHSSFEKGNWFGKAKYALTPDWDITTAYLGTRLQNAGRTDQLGKGDLRFYFNDDHLAYLRSTHRFQGALRELDATLSFHRLDEQIDRYSCSQNDDGVVSNLEECTELETTQITRQYRYEDRVDSLGLQLDSRWSFSSGRLRLLAGAEAYYDQVDSTLKEANSDTSMEWVSQDRGNFSPDSSFLSTGAFLNVAANILEVGNQGRIRASAGTRFSYFAAHAPDVPEFGDVDYSFSGLVGSASIQWIQSRKSNLYFSFNQGFRAPNLQETTTLGDTGMKFEIPNENLKPESAHSYELGFKMQSPSIHLHAALFYTLLTDTITETISTHNDQTEIDGKPVVQRVNAGDGLIRGLEVSTIVPWGNLSFDLIASLVEGDITDQDGLTTPMRRSPPLTGTAGIRYNFSNQRGSMRFYVQAANSASRLHPLDEKDPRVCETSPYSGTLDSPCSGTEGWTTTNFTVTWKFNSKLKTRFALLNMTDETYRWHGSGFDQPGFNTRLMLEGQF